LPEPTLLLLDGNSLINRAYFGLLGRQNLTAPDGTPTGALFAFLNMYLRYRDDIQPTHVVAAFDRKEPTFRHKRFDGYKATRKPMPDELAIQIPILKEILRDMGINCLEIPGYEADDLLGTLAEVGRTSQMPVYIVTGDKDSFQLADKGVTILQPVTRSGKTENERYDEAAIVARFQVTPAQFVDLKAIMGDPSDNIPGVKGIGEKGAMELIARYGSLDGVYGALDEIRPALAEKLRTSKEMAYLSQMLATICRTVPIPGDLSDYQVHPAAAADLTALLNRLGFQKILARLNLTETTANTEQSQLASCTAANLAAWQQMLAEKPDLPAISPGKDQTLIWTADPDQVWCLPASDCKEAWQQQQNSACRTAIYDYKQMLHATGLSDQGGKIHDVLIAAYLLNQIEGRPDFERLYQRVTGKIMPEAGADADLTANAGSVAKQAGVRALPVQTDLFSIALESEKTNEIIQDAAKEVGDTRLLAAKVLAIREIALQQKDLINERNIAYLTYDVEMPLAGILATMERRGFAVDEQVLDDLGRDMTRRLELLQQEIYTSVSRSFNLNSPRQLGEVLYNDLGLATGKKRSGGNFSTDSDELERLSGEHPVIPKIIEHRQTAKLLSTYIEGLKKVIDPADRRVHTTFNQTQTATGRLSSSEPNLQNIPIRMEAGQKIRQAFVAAPGHVLLDADYSQIELRLLAHLSGDPAMIDAFVRAEDIHTNTACRIFDRSPENITPEMRSIAKTMNFSIVYGISDFGLARDLGIPVRQAHHYIAEYEQLYPLVRDYLNQLVTDAYQNGYVETIFGRRRYLNELKSSNRNLRQFGERAAMNTPVQGTAADLIKIAMVRVADSFRQAGLTAGLILQVHDELIVEAPLNEVASAARILKQSMEGALVLKVPLLAEVRQGSNWAACK
jgi:DNA polymerase I